MEKKNYILHFILLWSLLGCKQQPLAHNETSLTVKHKNLFVSSCKANLLSLPHETKTLCESRSCSDTELASICIEGYEDRLEKKEFELIRKISKNQEKLISGKVYYSGCAYAREHLFKHFQKRSPSSEESVQMWNECSKLREHYETK